MYLICDIMLGVPLYIVCMHKCMHVCILYNITAMANLHCLNNKWTIVEVGMASHVGYEVSSLALITGLIIYEPCCW